MNTAETLRDQLLWVNPADLPELQAGEYYHYQLIDLAVVDSTGELRGRIESIEDNKSADNLVVVNDGGQHFLVPLIDDVIQKIDLDRGEIHLKPFEGLFHDPF